jgi:hypothetical protein
MKQIVVAMLLVAAAAAQDVGSFSRPKPSPTNRVSVLAPKLVQVPQGGKATTTLEFQVARGYHINSHKPGSELLVPTVLSLNAPTAIAVGVQYPDGRDFSLPVDPTEKLNVYTGDFAVNATVAASRAMRPGRYRVHGMLKYQACDDRACYPPAQLPLAFDVQVGKTSSGRVRRNPAQSPHIHQ